MTVITPLSEAHHRSLILAIFTSCGRARFLDEKYFDTCTALAGSGPAFVALVLEAMADGGVMMGLPRAEALELAAQSRSSFPNEAGLIRSDTGHRKARTGGRTASCPTKG
jgi:pyrroline-5-carboxylate reductase